MIINLQVVLLIIGLKYGNIHKKIKNKFAIHYIYNIDFVVFNKNTMGIVFVRSSIFIFGKSSIQIY